MLCHQKGMMTGRCLATTTILMETLGKLGCEVERFTCEVHGYSKKYIDKVSASRSMGNHTLSDRKKAEQWKAEGARLLSVFANRPDLNKDVKGKPEAEKPLEGHIALFAKDRKTGQAWFVDATAFQFTRTDAKNGWVLESPDFLINELGEGGFSRVKSLNELHKAEVNKIPTENLPEAIIDLPCGGRLYYGYRRLNVIEALEKKKGSKDWKRSDLNPEKYKEIISTVMKKHKKRERFNAPSNIEP